jgi:hypothetical protein
MEAAARVAYEFFWNVNEQVTNYRSENRISSTALPNPFPIRSLKHLSSYPMLGGNGRFPDHWISNWMLHLAPTEDENEHNDHNEHNQELSQHNNSYSPAPVYGGTVEVRIGPATQVIGLLSTVRFWDDTFLVDGYPHPHEEHGPAQRDDKGRPVPEIFFTLDSPGVRQPFLAPFLRNKEIGGHHHGSLPLRPTCIYSLIVDIGVARSEGEARVNLFALVLNAQGEMAPIVDSKVWKVIWFFGKYDHLMNEELDRRSSIDIQIDDTGVYHVEVSVEHIATGAFRSTHKQVIVGGRIEFDQMLLV